jgi:hypothetical protein
MGGNKFLEECILSRLRAATLIMTSFPQTNVNVVMGCMTFGEEGKEGARLHDLNDVQDILKVFHSHGHTEVCTRFMIILKIIFLTVAPDRHCSWVRRWHVRGISWQGSIDGCCFQGFQMPNTMENR